MLWNFEETQFWEKICLFFLFCFCLFFVLFLFLFVCFFEKKIEVFDLKKKKMGVPCTLGSVGGVQLWTKHFFFITLYFLTLLYSTSCLTKISTKLWPPFDLLLSEEQVKCSGNLQCLQIEPLSLNTPCLWVMGTNYGSFRRIWGHTWCDDKNLIFVYRRNIVRNVYCNLNISIIGLLSRPRTRISWGQGNFCNFKERSNGGEK